MLRNKDLAGIVVLVVILTGCVQRELLVLPDNTIVRIPNNERITCLGDNGIEFKAVRAEQSFNISGEKVKAVEDYAARLVERIRQLEALSVAERKTFQDKIEISQEERDSAVNKIEGLIDKLDIAEIEISNNKTTISLLRDRVKSAENFKIEIGDGSEFESAVDTIYGTTPIIREIPVEEEEVK